MKKIKQYFIGSTGQITICVAKYAKILTVSEHNGDLYLSFLEDEGNQRENRIFAIAVVDSEIREDAGEFRFVAVTGDQPLPAFIFEVFPIVDKTSNLMDNGST